MTKKNFYEFNLIVTNESRLPISIIDAKILNNDKVYSAKMDRQIIKQHKSKAHPDITFYSSEFPLNLSGLDSSKELIVFTLDEEIEKEEFTIIFTTSRGVIKKKVNFVGKEITHWIKMFLRYFLIVKRLIEDATRKSKIKYFLHKKGINIELIDEFIDNDIQNILELYHTLSNGTHGKAGRYTIEQLKLIKKRVEDGIKFLCEIVV